MLLRTSIITILSVLSAGLLVRAQDSNVAKSSFATLLQKQSASHAAKINTPFVPSDSWVCLSGNVFDLDSVTGPSVIMAGFSGCAPCRKALPVLCALAGDEKYSKLNFVYITFNKPQLIKEELAELELPEKGRVHFVSVADTYLQTSGIATGFPTVYFLHSSKIITAMYAYGQLNGPLESKQYLESIIDTLH